MFIIFSDLDFYVPASWSLIYKIKKKPELHVETTLANASSYRDLLSINNLVNSDIVSSTSEDMSSILERMKKCSRTDYTPSSSSAPLKRSRSSKVVSPV